MLGLVVASLPMAYGAQAQVRVGAAGVAQHTTFAFRPWLAPDARFVTFDSNAALLPGGVAGVRDVYVEDRTTEALERMSVASDGTAGNGDSARPTISADGRYVAFWSAATNLVPGDTNGVTDCFVHDRVTGHTTRVSVASDGTQGNGDSARPVISGDGQLVAFESAATNLVPTSALGLGGGHAKGLRDVFVHKLGTGETIQASVRSDGSPATGDSVRPSISQDGRYVAFDSDAALVPEKTNKPADVFVHELATGQTTRVSVASDGTQAKRGGSFEPSISGDGRFVAFWSNAKLVAGDTNRKSDVFVHDRLTGQTTLVSVASDGTQSNGGSARPAITPDGRLVAFWSNATTLVAGRQGHVQIYVHDRTTAQTSRASVADDGTPGDGDSYAPTLSGDGRVVAFDSKATNLVPNDPNRGTDVFVHDTATGRTTRVSARR